MTQKIEWRRAPQAGPDRQMRLLWLLSLRLAATRADTCAAATARIQGQTCNATALQLDCSEKYLSIIKCGGITYLFSRKELIIPVNGELVKKHEQRAVSLSRRRDSWFAVLMCMLSTSTTR